MEIRSLQGPAILSHLDDLASLRIRVFREYPYLYDGDLAYERDYIHRYAESHNSLFVLACEGDEVVGVSTGIPLEDEGEIFRAPFIAERRDPARYFYFGESVLLPEYRGRGIGAQLFEAREAHALQVPGIEWCAFCAVERPQDHPRRPPDYRPLDDFWTRRGYVHRPELRLQFHWKDLDEPGETAKPMSFWLKALSA